MRRPGPAALALLAAPTWRDVLLGTLFQWLIFVPLLSVLLGLALASDPNSVLVVAVISPVYSAPVGAIVTFILGVPLAKLLASVLARSAAWIGHLVAFLGLGFILAALLIHLWMLITGSLMDSGEWWESMPIFLPIASAAALSVGAGWGLAWQRATLRERAREKLLALLAE